MPCYRPLHAWQLDDGSIVFRELPNCRRALELPCGKCIGCYLERSRVWAVRIMHEAQMYDHSSFVTLTYDDDRLPEYGNLRHVDFRNFMKRLRRAFGPVRFFMAGEYGDERKRPHFHACLFGVHFADRKHFKVGDSGAKLYTSEALSTLWPFGHASVGDVTFESAGYVARYVTKKVGADLEPDRYLRWNDSGEAYWLTPEYCQMSRMPGIGYKWWQKYGQEVLNRGNVVMNGVEMKVPRYYGKLCSDPAFDWVEQQGIDKFKPEDNTEERLIVRERVTNAALTFKKRILQ